MKALAIYAGPVALQRLHAQGLQAKDIGVIPGAAGGPKGLLLGPLDRFLFGEWLPTSDQPIDLVGASIGAWRMATACLPQPVHELQALEDAYIHQHYELQPGQTRPTAAQVSADFAANLHRFYSGREQQVLQHPRYKLHVVTSHGRGILNHASAWRTPLGYAGAYLTNLVSRRAMGAWLERVVFSSSFMGQPHALPFATDDYRTRHVVLNQRNFLSAVQASCSIPFVLEAVNDIPDAPNGSYWDGGITDYHLHLDYRTASGLTLYPHFQKNVVPGWLDKALKWRHGSTSFLDTTIVLAPRPEWVQTLPRGKLPDRSDFVTYGQDLAARVAVWQTAVGEAQRLADEFAQWLDMPDMGLVQPL
jgi:hypothetical protein